MHLLPSAEQREIMAAAAGLLAKELPFEPAVTGPCAVDPALWRKLGGLGWFALAIGEEAGGAGYSLVEEALVMRELGRVVAPGPYVATMLAAKVAAGAGATELLGRLAAGEVTAGLGEPHHDAAAVVGPTVTGTFAVTDGLAPGGGPAGLVAVTDGRATALVDGAAARTRRAWAPIDPSVPVELVTFDAAEALAVDAPEPGRPGWADAARLLVAAGLVGVLEATRDQSVAYVSQREQFGRPIGAFQAVKHRCADLAVRAEAAGTLTFYAALRLAAAGAGAGHGEGDGAEVARLGAFAKSLAGEYALASGADNIQNHGGMGFTAESGVHRYLRRALVWNTVLGLPAQLLSDVLVDVAPELASPDRPR